MKTIDHQIIVWPEQAANSYRMWVMLDKCKLENKAAMAMLTDSQMIDLSRGRNIEELKDNLFQYLNEVNLPCRVEASDDLVEFTVTIVNFREVFDFIFGHEALSLVFYPTFYPTREAHVEDIEKSYKATFGE